MSVLDRFYCILCGPIKNFIFTCGDQTIVKIFSLYSEYSWFSLSRTRKGLENLFETERVRDRERKIGYSLHKETKTLVRDREKFDIEGVEDRESQLYTTNIFFAIL